MNNNKITNLNFLKQALIEWSSDESEDVKQKSEELLKLLEAEKNKINLQE